MIMPELTDKEVLISLKETLDEIKAILVLANQDKIESIKKSLLKEGSVKRQIYDLCDSTRGNKEIAAAIKKDESYVRSYITILRREGFIRTKSNTGFYEQIF